MNYTVYGENMQDYIPEIKFNAINEVVIEQIEACKKKYNFASTCLEGISNQIKCVKEIISISKKQLKNYDELKKDINPNDKKDFLAFLKIQYNTTKERIEDWKRLVEKYSKVLKNLRRKKRRENNSWKKPPKTKSKYDKRNCGDEPNCPPPSYAPPLPKYLPNGEKL